MLKKKLLVTGAAGFIGSNLAFKLLEQGFKVVCIDNFNEYYDVELKFNRKSRLDKLAKELDLDSESYHFENIDLKEFEKHQELKNGLFFIHYFLLDM